MMKAIIPASFFLFGCGFIAGYVAAVYIMVTLFGTAAMPG